MATKLVSPIQHSVSKNLRLDKRTVRLFEYKFEPGVPVEFKLSQEIEFADNLNNTYPEKYYTESEWKEFQKAKTPSELPVKDKYTGEVKVDPKTDKPITAMPSLEELQAKSLGDLKAIADEIGLKYGQTISGKTLATRISEVLSGSVEEAIEE